MPENTQMLTPDQVAERLQVSRLTVYNLIKRGDLAATKVGRRVRIREADLERYIAK